MPSQRRLSSSPSIGVRRVPRLVRVLDAQHELAAEVPREQVVEQRRAEVAEVRHARSGWVRNVCGRSWPECIGGQ